MKPKAKKKKGPPIDNFTTFKNVVSEVFDFLISDFGFKPGKITIVFPLGQFRSHREMDD